MVYINNCEELAAYACCESDCCVCLGSSGTLVAPSDCQITFCFNDEDYSDNTDPTEGWTLIFDGVTYGIDHRTGGTPGPTLVAGQSYVYTASGTLEYFNGSGVPIGPDGSPPAGGPIEGYRCPTCQAYSLVGRLTHDDSLIGPYETEAEAIAACGGDECTGWYCCDTTNTVVYLADCDAVDAYDCDDPVPTECCPDNDVPAKLYATFTALGGGNCDDGLNGQTFELIWDGSSFWRNTTVSCACNPGTSTGIYFYCCPTGVCAPFPIWHLGVNYSGVPASCAPIGADGNASASTCSPFDITIVLSEFGAPNVYSVHITE